MYRPGGQCPLTPATSVPALRNNYYDVTGVSQPWEISVKLLRTVRYSEVYLIICVICMAYCV